MNTNLNELIEAGRTHQAVDAHSECGYWIGMGTPPPNSQAGREQSLAKRQGKSGKHDSRILVAIAQAVVGGVDSLAALAEFLNDADVPTRRGGKWTLWIAAKEVGRTGSSIKELRSHAERQSATEPTTWSEQAFWRVVEEQRRVAERHGRWVRATDATPSRHDPVRHPAYDLGTFHRWDGPRMLCWFRPHTGDAFRMSVKPIEAEVFKWMIPIEKRDQLFERINKRYLTKEELVKTSSLSLAQRQARQRVMRWF
jgi:hypothetical protein